MTANSPTKAGYGLRGVIVGLPLLEEAHPCKFAEPRLKKLILAYTMLADGTLPKSCLAQAEKKNMVNYGDIFLEVNDAG
jgi:hypothetical protein